MYLDSVVQTLQRKQTISSTDIYSLNEAVFNMSAEEQMNPRSVRALFQVIRKIGEMGSTRAAKQDIGYFYDYVGMLATMQNQTFFSEKQNQEIIDMLSAACATKAPAQKPAKAAGPSSKDVDRLKAENKRLTDELAKLDGIKGAVEEVLSFEMPAYLQKASKAKGSEGDAKAKDKGKKAKGKEEADAPKPPPLPPLTSTSGGLVVATWNLSAVNNNPFEYWVSLGDEHYDKLLADIQALVESPGDKDVAVEEVFGEQRFADLKGLMDKEAWEGLDVVERMWKDDFSKRKIISGFLTDKTIGSKRLTSMPDRITNTIRLSGSGRVRTACRPTVISCFPGSLATLDTWWPQWTDFMFKKELQLEPGKDGKTQRPCQMLAPIKKEKYPAITEEEEKVSVPLQALCQAILDAILVHVMTLVSPDGRWQSIKQTLVNAIYRKKEPRTLAILKRSAAGADIICLQETASSFLGKLRKEMGRKYHIIAGEAQDRGRDQNSIVLLHKARFPKGSSAELSSEVVQALSSSSTVATGDVLAVTAEDKDGVPFLIASFHGDTNGLATKPVVSAVKAVLDKQPAGCRLVMGTDANTYIEKVSGQQDVEDFLKHIEGIGLRSCWPSGKPMTECRTTCIARTFLQTQLNKAIRAEDKISKGDVNPKDHILVQSTAFEPVETIKDNTGDRKYVEDSCLPALNFPSDHGMLLTVLSRKE